MYKLIFALCVIGGGVVQAANWDYEAFHRPKKILSLLKDFRRQDQNQNVTFTEENQRYINFDRHLVWLNELYADPQYFCSSIRRKHAQYWVLRNKKCLRFSYKPFSYTEAYSVCKSQPYAYTYLISQNEIRNLVYNKEDLLRGLDIYNIYYRLAFDRNPVHKQTITIWLNELADYECDRNDAPVVHLNENDCKHGCFDCMPKTYTHAYFICAKLCDWKVPQDSYCNTMNMNDFQINKNLYYQREHLTYVCQGNMSCIDHNCQCANGQNFYSKYNCI